MTEPALVQAIVKLQKEELPKKRILFRLETINARQRMSHCRRWRKCIRCMQELQYELGTKKTPYITIPLILKGQVKQC